MAERYEADGKYWELEPKGKTAFTARWGKIGGSGRNERAYTFADAAAATKTRDKLVADKQKAGFALVGKATKTKAPVTAAKSTKKSAGAKSNTKLEAELAANPEDAGTWSVYADWLLEQGEAWGAEIAAAVTGKRAGKQRSAAEAEILGELDGSTIKWKHGTIDVLELCPEEDPGDDGGDSAKELPMARALARALAHPAGRLVRTLVLGLPPGAGIKWDYEPLFAVITKAGPLPLLHTLDLAQRAEHMDQLSWRSVGDMRKVWAALPRLRDLKLLGSGGGSRGGKTRFGDMVAPELESLVFESSGLARDVAIAIGKAKLPALRHLELYFGRADYGNDHKIGDLAGILSGKGLPKLEYLGLENSEWEAELVEAVAKSAILPRLKTLDLSKGVLYADGAAALVKHAAKFKHLEELVLDENFLQPEHYEPLEALLPNLEIGSQNDPDEFDDELYRYTAMGE